MVLRNSTIWWWNYSTVCWVCQIHWAVLLLFSLSPALERRHERLVCKCREKCAATMNLLKATFLLQTPQFEIRLSVF